ncbi:MAG: hypothetical protein EBY68_05725 [Actinobacteria bacterium]|nr:hypothetical protein [Actinomycetota bacterium]
METSVKAAIITASARASAGVYEDKSGEILKAGLISFRAYSREKVPTADLSRGLAGTHSSTLIINLPGSPGAVKDGLVIIERLAGHIHEQLRGKDHG